MNRFVMLKIALYAGAAAYAALCALFFPLGLMLLPAALAFAAAAWGKGAFALSTLLSAAGVFLSYGGDAQSAAGALILYIPSALLLAYFFSTRKSYRVAVALLAAAFSLGLYALVCLPSLLAGNGPFAALTEFVKEFGAAILQTASSMNLDAQAMELFENMVAALPYTVPSTATLSMISTGMAAGMANVLIARALLRRAKRDTRPMARFSEWQLSRSFTLGSLILLIGALAVQLINVANADAIATAVECVVGAPYALMGVCTMAFTSRIKAKSKGFFVLSIVALALLFPYSMLGLCMIGAADRLFNIRRAYLARNGKK